MDYQAFFKLSYGIYLVCARYEQELSGYVANTAFQVSSEPPRVAISCHKKNRTIGPIQHSRAFSLSVLHRDASMKLIQTFGYSSDDPGFDHSRKFEHVRFNYGQTGSPVVLTDAIAYLECRVTDAYDQGTHILFIGEVVDAVVLDEKREPMTYAYYRDVKKAYAPPHAPTYIDIEKLTKGKEAGNKEYLCQICGYIYDPEEGDPRNGIPPGTAWEDLPADWVCPVCGAGKDEFQPVD